MSPKALPRIAAQFARGVAMGAADVVPGVSGGTVAFVLGIYTELIDALSEGARVLGALLTGRPREAWQQLRGIDFGFLLPLLAGILAAVALLAHVIEDALREHPEAMAGLFFGLVAGSVWVAWRLLRTRSPANLAIMATVGVAVFALLGLQSGPVADPSPVVLFASGALAVCAMILPGISGSLILLLIGMYAAVIGAIDDRAFADLAVFAAGALAGIASFSALLHRLLQRAFEPVMAALIGLMAGSLRVLWPWPNGVGVLSEDETELIDGSLLGWPDGDAWAVPTLLGLVALAAVIATSRLSDRKSLLS